MLKFSADNKTLELTTPYDPDFVDQLKSQISPWFNRKWDSDKAVWVVVHTAENLAIVARLLDQYFGYQVKQPVSSPEPVVSQFERRMWYIGAAKQRNDGQTLAYGTTGKDGHNWQLVFPLDVLLKFFGGHQPTQVLENQNYFQLLGLEASSKITDKAVKSHYRTMAKQYHPDVANDDVTDPHRLFQLINEAYEVLKAQPSRNKYLAAVKMTNTLRRPKRQSSLERESVWIPPFRCGDLTVKALESGGYLMVKEIVSWKPIVNAGLTAIPVYTNDGLTIEWR